jgi:hypothetical protein
MMVIFWKIILGCLFWDDDIGEVAKVLAECGILRVVTGSRREGSCGCLGFLSMVVEVIEE